MKIDRTRIKRSTTEVPPDCKVLIEKLKACENKGEKNNEVHLEASIIAVLENVHSWTFGKCELYHWIDVLDIFDSVLQKAAEQKSQSWIMACDVNDNRGILLQRCVKIICFFTSLLIEHSFSRTLYNSMEHLTALLNTRHLSLLLEVLHLLYIFSKRSNFLTRLAEEKRDILMERLIHLAESWGGKEAGFGLADCCLKKPIEEYPSTATTVHMEYARELSAREKAQKQDAMTVLHLTHLDKLGRVPGEILDDMIKKYSIPTAKQLGLLYHIRLAANFSKWEDRVQLVQARLMALSILVYANAIQENTQQLLYSGLMEEMVDVLEVDKPYLTEIKAAALKTLTSIIHLHTSSSSTFNFPNIIDATGAGSYHGFLPVMVRNCIAALTSSNPEEAKSYPLPLATSLFSFLYHLASYELGGEALVNCGMLESLLKVVSWNTVDVEHITFVTRAVRVIDLITNMDMQAFLTHNGLAAFINRLEMEVNACRVDQSFEINPLHTAGNSTSNPGVAALDDEDVPMETESSGIRRKSSCNAREDSVTTHARGNATTFEPNGTVCLPQRAALLKSMLNFLKKVIQDPAFSDGIRHIMEGSLPNSLKHIISNAEYYGASLFLLATDVVTVYVFQEPSLLSTLQDSQLTDVVTEALLVKDVPPTREVISQMPNVFSALCLNSRGLTAFLKYTPFKKLFGMLITPEYLPAMRRRRTAEPMGDTATILGNAMDELMRHQPSLKVSATEALVQLLEELSEMGSGNKVSKAPFKSSVMSVVSTNPVRSGASEGGSSEDDDEDEEETSTASHSQPAPTTLQRDETGNSIAMTASSSIGIDDKTPIPFMDYVLNVMKCLDAILSNNSTDDHCKEFVNQGGLRHLISILMRPTLPTDFPNSPACQATSSVCRSILTLAHEKQVLTAGIQGLSELLLSLKVLGEPLDAPGSSVLLRELANSKNPLEAVHDPSQTRLLHSITAVHSLVMMFIHVCRTGQSDIRTMAVTEWGSPEGLYVLRDLAKLYLNLVWESTVLLALCSGEYQPKAGEFARSDLDRLIPPDSQREAEVSIKSARDVSVAASQSTSPETVPENMDVDSDSNHTNQPVFVNSSTQTTQVAAREVNSMTLQNYAKLIKPVLSASSRLGRALAELFGLLVKLCVGSPLRQRRGHHLPLNPGVGLPGSTQLATVLAKLLSEGLRWIPQPNSPIPRITFSICAVGFSAPLLFDEKKFPYHLMLRMFVDCGGLESLFDVFYWAMNESNNIKSESSESTLSEHQMEFLESWLSLVEKFSNPKTVLDNQHMLLQRSLILISANFELTAFLSHMHKKAFEAVLYLWKCYDVKFYGPRSVETMLTILCHIFRFQDSQSQNKQEGQGNQVSTVKDETRSRTANQTGNLERIDGDVAAVASAILASSNSGTSGLSARNPSVPITSSSANLIASIVQSTIAAESNNVSSNPTTSSTEMPVASNSDSANNALASTSSGTAGNRSSSNPEVMRILSPEGSRAVQQYGLDPNHLAQLLEMGFALPLCIEALFTSTSVIAATDFLLAMGPNVLAEDVNPAGTAGTSATTPWNTTEQGGRPLSVDLGERTFPPNSAPNLQSSTRPPTTQDDMELGDGDEKPPKLVASQSSNKNSDKANKSKDNRSSLNLEPLNQEDVDLFTDTVLEQCLSVLDKIPDCVHRVCELLAAVGERNGGAWVEKTLSFLMKEIMDGMNKLSLMIRTDEANLILEDFIESSKTLTHRIHLYTLMFEETRYMCAFVLEQQNGIRMACQLLEEYSLAMQNRENKKASFYESSRFDGILKQPGWIAPLLLMIDLYEKACVASTRRWVLYEETDHQWKWFDINSGKWCAYSPSNNKTIDQAFWLGESTVKITAGRRRYVINFNAMIQLNEETSNRRPITLWLKNPKTKEETLVRTDSPPSLTSDSESEVLSEGGSRSLFDRARSIFPHEYAATGRQASRSGRGMRRGGSTSTYPKSDKPEAKESKALPYVKGKWLPFKSLDRDAVNDLIKCSVLFMKYPIEPELLHAVMRLCLRLTRNYEIAVKFANLGGIQTLLNLTQKSSFTGVLPLCNLLIRHVMEDPACLRYAVEKMIRAKALSTGASTCKELHYLLRVLAPIACRSSDIFVKVAKDILRVDMNFVTRRGKEEDMRLIVKPVPCKPESLITYMGEAATSVIQQLLTALTTATDEEKVSESKPHPSTPVGRSETSKKQNKNPESSSAGANSSKQVESMELDVSKGPVWPRLCQEEYQGIEFHKKPRLFPKDAICQLLAESVHSYSYTCKIIAEFSFPGGISPLIQEDCTALAFLLDKMLPPTSPSGTNAAGDKDCSTVVRDLISAMAGCNHLPEAQAIVISEVKAALSRALNMEEGAEMHSRIQALSGLICNMIEACPSTPSTQMVSVVKPSQLCMNTVVRLLIKKNVVMDLARISHSLDLSSPHLAATINASLKPLEVISRIVNQPAPVNPNRSKLKSESATQDSVNNTNTGGTSNSELTHAQGEETVEDADNTEHDISAAAESLLDPNSESVNHDRHANEDVLDDIMDQLLERDGSGQADDQMLADALVGDLSGNRMDTEQGNQREGRYAGDNTENDTSDSDSDSSEDEEDEDGNGNNVEEEEEDEEDDDEEEEEDDDDDDAGSNFEDREPEFIDDSYMRWSTLNRGLSAVERDEDLLVVQYAQDENTPVFFTNNASYNLNVGLFDDPLVSEHSSGLRLNHPLLTAPTVDQPASGAASTRGHRAARRRGYIHFPRNPPAAIQRLLGPSTAQEVIQLTSGQSLSRDGNPTHARIFVMDGVIETPAARNGAGGSSSNLSNYTALHWWCEEAKVLDGESMHDQLIMVKREIVDVVEEERDKAFKLRKEKREKELEESKRKLMLERDKVKASLTAEFPHKNESSVSSESSNNEPTTSTLSATLRAAVTGSLAALASGSRPAIPQESGTNESRHQEESSMEVQSTDETPDREQQSTSPAPLPPGVGRARGRSRGRFINTPTRPRRSGLRSSTRSSQRDAQTQSSMPEPAPPTLSPPHNDDSYLPELVNVEENTNQRANTVTEPGTETSVAVNNENSAAASATPAAGVENTDTAANIVGPEISNEPMPGPSGGQSLEEYRGILGDIVVPEGVDPSFLAALPEEMRQEVINEHLRVQRLRQRAQAVSQETTSNVADVSPEFLAALPPNIQEEVLAQQRLEQQRQVATASNPNDPVDTEAFFRNLQPSLRQAILADMEDSQIAVLPPDLASEAQNLRREWETRNRQLLQDRFFSHSNHTTTTLSSILRNSGIPRHMLDISFILHGHNSQENRAGALRPGSSRMRLSSRYGLQNITQRAQWSNTWSRCQTAMNSQLMLSGKVKGKQLVDNETLSCLLVLLFLDDPRLNTGRLHRVLRNLCYHASTRQWVIKALLSVMERANECSVTGSQLSDHSGNAPEQAALTSPTWLNLSLDAALGCRANVFEIHARQVGTTKKGGVEKIIFIHAQAVPSLSRHTLDVLSNLAKSFPCQFLPSKLKPSLYCTESNIKLPNCPERRVVTPPPEYSKGKGSSSSKSKGDASEFWDILLKLDSYTTSRKGKSIVKNLSTVDPNTVAVSFEASPFGHLIYMLAYGFVRRSTLLTDKLLRLLSLISLGIPDTSGFGRRVLLAEPETSQDTSILITESHLRLIVEVITSKSCSEEGLEDATSLLVNLSYGPPSTRDKILNLLMEGVRQLGIVVCSHIASLQREIESMRKKTDDNNGIIDGSEEAGPSTADQDPEKVFKGTLQDRFTRDTVVIQSGKQNKATCELQLPSMSLLTSKTSSQAFFLRLLKVIINLREAIRLAIKKHKMKGAGPSMSSTIISSLANNSNWINSRTGLGSDAVRPSQRLREAFRRASRTDGGEDQPMDVDGDHQEQPAEPRSQPLDFSALVDIDESSDEDDDGTAESQTNDPDGTPTAIPKENKEVNMSEPAVPIDELKLLPRLSGLLNLDQLWETLSECLLELGHTPDHHAVLVLQPAVEAFFLVHASAVDKEEKKTVTRESREAQLAHIQQDLPPVSPIQAGDPRVLHVEDTEMFEPHNSTMLDSSTASGPNLSPDTQKFLKFAETHRTVLNQILRQSVVHLADGPFSVLVDHTRVLDFDVKRRYFRTELERLDEGVRREDLAVHVRRSHVFEDSFRELHRRSAEEWKNRFYIVFEGEEGQDAGGLLREWYVIISREIFNPMYALFTISPGDRVTYMINPSSHCNSNHLFYFKFVGRVIAKAIYDNKLLECYFTRSFYKHILGKYVKYTDMESEDYSFYQGLVFLMDNNVADLGYELTFSTEVQEFGVTEVRDLISNGRNIAVTEENKMEYIRLVCQMKMTGAIRKQLNAFLEGFYDIIPKRLISIFNEQELELLVSGLPNIDIEDLKSNTEYHKYQPNSLQIQWFWRALRSFDQADRAKLLQFVTGTSKVPLQGFGALEGMNGVQKFQIHRDDRSTDRLPSAHTCFNQLDLPAYETYDKLRSYMMKAIHECSEGFGFA